MEESRNRASASLGGRRAGALRVTISVGLLAYVTYGTDWGALAANFRKLTPSVVLWVLAINLGAHVFLALRWQLALQTLRIQAAFATVTRCYWVGLFFNLFLPSSIGGDVARSYYLYRARHKPQLAAASSLLDRWAGFLALILMGWVASLFLPEESGLGFLRTWMLLGLAAFAAASLVLMGRRSRRIRALGRKRLRSLGRGRLRPLSVALRSVSTSLRFVPRRLDLLAASLACTVAYYALLTVTHALLARDLGLEAPLSALATYVSLMAILSMVPVTVNGIGLRETLYVGLFAASGWPAEAALTLSWVIFASVLLAGVPGFFLAPAVSRKDSVEHEAVALEKSLESPR